MRNAVMKSVVMRNAVMKNVQGAVCVNCGAEYPAEDRTYTCPKCGGVLEIVYDYAYIKTVFTKEKLARRGDPTLWRYRELLPIEEDSELSPLRVGGSPLYRAERLGKILGLKNLYIKDDGLNPTASLKDRASAVAVVRAGKAGINTVACSSTGNAASSLAGNAAALGLRSFIFVPERAPVGKLTQLLIFGAVVISVKGNYEDTFRLSAEAIEKYGWYNRNAAINPYLSEGKKTVSLEIAEQLGFRVPDYLAVSVGDGCTIAGVWKGFKDLYAIGFIDRLPRLVSVQAAGCCPINRAFESGEALAPMEENTIADSIAVGVPRNGEKALRAIRESNGIAVNVSDEEILEAMRLLGASAGIFGEPAGVAATAGLKKAAAQGLIPENALVVSAVTGNGLKDTAGAQRAAGEPIRIPADMELLVDEFRQRNIRP
jgi:threonine synthase